MRLQALFIFSLIGLSLQAEYSVLYAEEIMQGLANVSIVPTEFELKSGGYSFKIINRGLAGSPHFTLNGQPYYVLGSLNCSDGENPLYNVNTTQWFCGTFPGYNPATSLGTVGALNCSASSTLRYYSNGTWSCSSDEDKAALLSCGDNQRPVFDGSAWDCDDDEDTLSTLQCSVGDVLQYTAGGWNCYSPLDGNLLGNLTAKCTSPSFLVHMTAVGEWSCIEDVDTLGAVGAACSVGNIFKYNGAAVPACGTDNDTIRDLNCPMGSTIINNGTIACITAPIHNAAPPTVFVDGQVLASSTQNFVFQPTFFGSHISRDVAPFKFPQGFVVLGYGFSLSMDPRTSSTPDPGFNISVNLMLAGSNQVLHQLFLPPASLVAYTSTHVAFPPLHPTGLNVKINMVGLHNTPKIGITTTLLVSINNPTTF